MKFNRPKFNAQDTKQVKWDINVCFKEYVQSFLFWMYRQNPNFAETLTDEEIVNFFFKRVDLPIWIQFIRHKTLGSNFRFMTEVYQYVLEYKKHADMMIYTYPVFMLDSVEYVQVKTENQDLKKAKYEDCVKLNLNPEHTFQKDIDIYSYLKGEKNDNSTIN